MPSQVKSPIYVDETALGAMFGSAQFRKINSPRAAQKVLSAARGKHKKKRAAAIALVKHAADAAKKGDPAAKVAVSHLRNANGSEGILVRPGGGIVRGKRWRQA